MNRFKYPLFSDSLVEYFRILKKEYDNNIAAYLLTAHIYWKCLNKLTDDTDQEIMIQKVDELVTENVSMLAMRENVFEISFLPNGKVPVYRNRDLWSKENRQLGKPTRIIKKLIKAKYSDAEYENFNNLLRACIEKNCAFEVVSKENIPHWYNYMNYHALTGTLETSCMRNVPADYFDIYQDHAEMLVLKKHDRLIGRALVWTIDGMKYLDRVYYAQDHLYQKFIDYAMENQWAYRSFKGVLAEGDQVSWYVPGDDYKSSVTLDLRIQLKKCYGSWPYMDSLRYYYPSEDLLSTSPDVEGAGKYIELLFTDGGLGDPYTCRICGETLNIADFDDQEDMFYSNYLDDYICSSCAVWSEDLSDWLAEEDSVRALWSRRESDWVPANSDDIVLIGEEYWFERADRVCIDEKTNTYYLKDE